MYGSNPLRKSLGFELDESVRSLEEVFGCLGLGDISSEKAFRLLASGEFERFNDGGSALADMFLTWGDIQTALEEHRMLTSANRRYQVVEKDKFLVSMYHIPCLEDER